MNDPTRKTYHLPGHNRSGSANEVWEGLRLYHGRWAFLGEHLDLFVLNGGCELNDEFEGGEFHDADLSDETPIFTENLLKSVDELELSVRSYNCLKNADIQTIGDLVQRSDQEMLKTKNFGRKSLNEIKAILKTMGLRFGMRIDVEAFEAAMARKQAGGGSDAA